MKAPLLHLALLALVALLAWWGRGAATSALEGDLFASRITGYSAAICLAVMFAFGTLVRLAPSLSKRTARNWPRQFGLAAFHLALLHVGISVFGMMDQRIGDWFVSPFFRLGLAAFCLLFLAWIVSLGGERLLRDRTLKIAFFSLAYPATALVLGHALLAPFPLPGGAILLGSVLLVVFGLRVFRPRRPS